MGPTDTLYPKLTPCFEASQSFCKWRCPDSKEHGPGGVYFHSPGQCRDWKCTRMCLLHRKPEGVRRASLRCTEDAQYSGKVAGSPVALWAQQKRSSTHTLRHRLWRRAWRAKYKDARLTYESAMRRSDHEMAKYLAFISKKFGVGYLRRGSRTQAEDLAGYLMRGRFRVGMPPDMPTQISRLFHCWCFIGGVSLVCTCELTWLVGKSPNV